MMEAYNDIADVMGRCRFPLNPGVLSLVTVRGSRVVGDRIIEVPERPNLFDDTMFALTPERGILWHAPCTGGQPGWYWVNRYEAGDGAPFTRPGRYAYVRGDHRGHPALRQRQDETGRLAVIRDLDKDGRGELSERFGYPLTTGINIHSSGGHFETVDWTSSGCHVVEGSWDGTRWTAFMDLVDAYRSQGWYPYSVVESAWIGGNTIRLTMGSRGEDVADLQRFLNAKDRADLACRETGEWRAETDKVYRKWQRLSGQPAWGICVNPPWP